MGNSLIMKLFSTIAIFTALLLSSCANDDLLSESNASGNRAISVNPTVSASSRGQAIDNIGELAASGNGFSLVAYVEGSNFMGSKDENNLLSGVNFEYSNGAWNYVNESDMHFWNEAEGKAINFYAVSPANNQKIKLIQSPENSSTMSDLRIDYTIDCVQNPAYDTSNLTPQVDLMYAKTENVSSTGESTNNGVQLEFKHALSQILIKAKTTDPSIEAEIKSLAVNIKYAGGRFSFKNEKWEEYTQGNTMNLFPVDIENGSFKVTSTASDVNTSDDALLLIPQKFTDEDNPDFRALFYIAFTLKHKRSGGDYTIFENKALFVPIATTNISEWESGKKYTYTLIFSEDMAEPIKVAGVTVDRWNEENSNVTNWNTTNIGGLTYHSGRNEFLISTPHDIKTLAELVNSGATYTLPDQGEVTHSFAEATYSQINDIDIDNVPDIARYSPDGNTKWGIGNFDPIGRTKARPFKGTYKGNGYFINDLYFLMDNGVKPDHIALFGMIQGATIQDLTINCRLMSYDETAAFVGEDLGGSKLYNCTAKGIDRAIEGSAEPDKSHIVALGYNCGGIIGKCLNTTIEHCTNYCYLVGANINQADINYTGKYMGGIAGSTAYTGGTDPYNDSNLTKITACINYGTVTAAYYNGGILGIASAKTEIMGCVNCGNVYLINTDAATTGCGGIVSALRGKCVGCYNWSEVSAGGSTSTQPGLLAEEGNENQPTQTTGIGAIVGAKTDDNTTITSCYYRFFNYTEYNGGKSGWTCDNTAALNEMNQALRDNGCEYQYIVKHVDTVNDRLMIPVKQ